MILRPSSVTKSAAATSNRGIPLLSRTPCASRQCLDSSFFKCADTIQPAMPQIHRRSSGPRFLSLPCWLNRKSRSNRLRAFLAGGVLSPLPGGAEPCAWALTRRGPGVGGAGPSGALNVRFASRLASWAVRFWGAVGNVAWAFSFCSSATSSV